MANNNIISVESRDSEKQADSGSEVRGSTADDERLVALGYKPQFRREMSLFGVLGLSFCAIGMITIY
jgi:hypothetical protein